MEEAAVTVTDPGDAVREWFQKLTLFCSTVDYRSARDIFSEDVASFGTHADAVMGLERLQAEQWEQVWPRTSGFQVLMDTVIAGGTQNLAWGMATWTSTGFDEEGNSFERRGRATVVLGKSGDRWLAVHTHFSLYRGVRQDIYGASGS